MFIPYLLYKKTTQCTFTRVALFDSSLVQMAEHSKLSGPVQIHTTTVTLGEKGNDFCLRGFSRELGASDFSFLWLCSLIISTQFH